MRRLPDQGCVFRAQVAAKLRSKVLNQSSESFGVLRSPVGDSRQLDAVGIAGALDRFVRGCCLHWLSPTKCATDGAVAWSD
jgi:hypothetical protein